MKINIVTVKSGWILSKIAERIAAAGNEHYKQFDWKVSYYPQMHNVVNFYCDVQNCYSGPTRGLDVGLFTHIHANDPSTVNHIAFSLDYIFHMCKRYLRTFADMGFDSNKMNIMVPFETPQGWEPRKPSIGIFQRGKFEGKGYHFMWDFADSFVCKNFKWYFVGNEWGPVVQKLIDNGCEVVDLADEKLRYPEDYHRMYSQCDYVLIPSKWEGGPIACLEAMSLGIPVIASDVGWCKDWGARIFKNEKHLENILWNLNKKERHLSDKVKSITSYKRCAKQIRDLALGRIW